ncbi:MAG: indole-3-glycerol phosphate synthase TrpC, partial [Candidatus Omnitrophica bacterium]|nr:indole-3-glycerol phosphate synthase TrpC [Candidatus Omnitrophota bacterium]
QEEIRKRKALISQREILKEINSLPPPRDFKSSISKTARINLIAELKKSSPSKGILRSDFNHREIAAIYEASGADALSVLTEEPFFQGSISYIRDIKEVISLPLLRKDFIIDLYQIYESRYYEADAVLLIACLLSEEELKKFAEIAKSLSLEVMVEVHTEEDLKKVLALKDILIIGINNRNLFTFEVDLETTGRLKRLIPEEKIVVSESGIDSYEDVMYLKSLGVNAVLIGEAFMTAEDIGGKIKKIMGR